MHRRGEPKPGAVVFTGVAHSVQRAEVEAALAAKYGWQWRVALRIEWLISRCGIGATPPRAALRITPEPGRSDAELAFRRP